MTTYELEQKAIAEGSDYRYVSVCERNGDIFVNVFINADEANQDAEWQWNHLTAGEQEQQSIYAGFVMASECGQDEDGNTDWNAYDALWRALDLFDSSHIGYSDICECCRELSAGDYYDFCDKVTNAFTDGTDDPILRLLAYRVRNDEDRQYLARMLCTEPEAVRLLWDCLIESVQLPDGWEFGSCDKACRLFCEACLAGDPTLKDDEIEDAISRFYKNNLSGIKAIRVAHGITQQELSDLTGIPKRSIENWESGSRKPPEWLPKMIACYLDAAPKKDTKSIADMIREAYPDASGREYLVNRCRKMYGDANLNIYITFKRDVCGVGSIITNDIDILIRLLNGDNVMSYDIFAK